MNSLKHVAIIMDGNGRWAIKRNKSRNQGHKKGLENIKEIINFCKSEKVKFLTLYVFSFDNWKRTSKEIEYLFALLENFLVKNSKDLINNKIKIKFIGEKKGLKKNLIKVIKKVQNETSKSYDITVNLAFNYSSRLELVNVLKENLKNLKPDKKITLSTIEKSLYTKNIPDPEILIRTGGHNRLSDFLLWQAAYSEIFFLKKLWPDFKVIDLKKIFLNFRKIKRNFGSADE